jgi:sulfide:quinone oxidoreductase
MANILILGGGFGGLIAAEKLASAFGSEHQITLVSKSRKFIFYPALVQVALGKFKPKDISFDLREKLTDLGVRFSQGEVIRINAESRSVSVAKEDYTVDVDYDYLVFALGRRLETEKIPGFFEHAHHLLEVEAALKFGAAVKGFRGGRIVVGMCPDALLPVPACETAFALARRFETEIAEKKISITVVFPETVREAFGGAKIYGELEWAFEKHDIELVENFPVREISRDKISSDDGRAINHNLLMLVPPFKGQETLKNMGIADESGYAKVNKFMQVAQLPQTYAVGDCTALAGPKLAHMAVRQAAVAAKNIASEIKGEQPDEVYHHEISTIIDQGGADSIYLQYGIWNDKLYRLQEGTLWSWVKSIHDRYWQAVHF